MLKNNKFVLTLFTGSQTWEIDKKSLIYTGREWSVDKKQLLGTGKE